jgi:murein DD-endopeptidase MepM/ murein hydrolase activator NlpD
MSVLRLILALPFAFAAFHQTAVHPAGSELASAAPANTTTWPWLPKGGAFGPYATPTRTVSIRSRSPERRWSYDWPLKPFAAPHPVRAYLDDPRVSMDSSEHNFHFGIDISAKGNTPVFAIEPGIVHLHGAWTVTVRSGARTFEYWHIVPSVKDGQRVNRHTLLGRTRTIFNHVHLSEFLSGRYVNPLRAGGLGPFADRTAPTIARLTLRQAGRWSDPHAVRGAVDLVADSFDIVPDVKPGPWPATPALLRWRILQGTRVMVRWQTAHDFRGSVLKPAQYGRIYASGTRMNHPGWAGYFCFYLAHGWNSHTVHNGNYRLEVAASDIRGNVGLSFFDFTVAN